MNSKSDTKRGNMGSKFAAGTLLLTLTLILTLACSGRDSLTVEEYAQLVCGDESDITDTWGDLAKSVQEGLNKIEGANPPDEMRDYHNALTTSGTALIKLAKSKPQGETINLFELTTAPELLDGVMATENLPAETKEILAAAGCQEAEYIPIDQFMEEALEDPPR